MLKRPNIRNPTDFRDIFTVLLAAVIIIGVFSVIIDDDSVRDLMLILLVIAFGWVAWAVHNILVKHTEEQDETF